MGLKHTDSGAQKAAPNIPAPTYQDTQRKAATMHLPESLQDLADSETVRFLKRPKSISRVCGGVRPCGSVLGWGRGRGQIGKQAHRSLKLKPLFTENLVMQLAVLNTS